MPILPTEEEVRAIAALQEPVLRNLQITQCYFELSQAMKMRTGACANWCTFATWASRQAGQTIRKEDLLRAWERLFTPATDRALNDVATETQREEEDIRQRLWAVLDPVNIINHASDAVARGNQKVFAEIGLEFARFLAICGQDGSYDENKLTLFCKELRDGDPPDGQGYLQQAFTWYYKAFFEPNAKKRAELILLANIEIGFHEQTRLQPEIAEALNASIPEPVPLLRQLLQALFPYRAWLVYTLLLLMRWIGKPLQLDVKLQRLVAASRRRLRLFLTKHMMVLCIPEGKYLKLGEDLHAVFPESLLHVSNVDLQALLQRVDPTPDSIKASGALDWADLPDRLHYIVDLFRCYHEAPDLLEAPFTPKQTNAIKEGQVPEGVL